MSDLENGTLQRFLDGRKESLCTLIHVLFKRQPCLRYESAKNAHINAIFLVGDKDLRPVYDAALVACSQGKLESSRFQHLDFEYGDKMMRFVDYHVSFADLLHWAKHRFPEKIPYKVECSSSQNPLREKKPSVVDFEIDTGELHFKNTTIKINTNTNQYELCKLLFSGGNKDLRSKFGTLDFQDALGGNEQGKKTLIEKMRSAHRHLNDKICKKTTLGDLISWENQEVFINPKYLKS